jgi:hypothetical protein
VGRNINSCVFRQLRFQRPLWPVLDHGEPEVSGLRYVISELNATTASVVNLLSATEEFDDFFKKRDGIYSATVDGRLFAGGTGGASGTVWYEEGCISPGIIMSRKKLRLQQRQMPPNDIDYLEEMPTAVPAGKILVHNNVVPAKRIGSRGFRIWYVAPDSAKYVVCDCGWAAELGEHYRINTES